MKPDEAIQILRTWRITGDKSHEALDMAIEALAKDINVPINDCISRQAAIDAMTNTLWHYPNECYRNLNEYEFAKGLAELGLKSVPSAEPERKKGKWIECDHEKWIVGVHALRCSECNGGYHLNNEVTIYYWNYCPNCGADMRGEQDETN